MTAARSFSAAFVACLLASTCLLARARLDLISRVGQESYPTGETTVQLTIGVVAPESTVRSALSLVLDISDSMKGEKLQRTKDLAKMIVNDSAANRDAFSLVTFGDEAKVVTPFMLLEPSSADTILEEIENIEPDGKTNLAGGLFMGIEQLQTELDDIAECRAKAVFFLSDGMPTEGITRKDQILDEMEKRRTGDIHISTFPFSNHSDFDLLTDIANNTGGESYPISELDDVINAFAMEQSNLQTRSVEDITLNLGLQNGATLEQILTPGNVTNTSNSIRITFPSLSATERRFTFLVLKVPALDKPEHDLMQMELNYFDVKECQPVIEEAQVITIKRVSEPAEEEEDLEVEEAKWRFVVAEAFMDSAGFMESGDAQQAADRLGGVSSMAANSKVFQRSEFVRGYSSGTQELSDLLRGIQSPNPYETAVVRELCDSMFKESTSMPNLERQTFGFLQFFDNPILEAARRRARAIINGEVDDPPAAEGRANGDDDEDEIAFPPFPPELGGRRLRHSGLLTP